MLNVQGCFMWNPFFWGGAREKKLEGTFLEELYKTMGFLEALGQALD